MEFERNEHVRVKGEPKGSIDEFARIQHIYENGDIWIVNGNMPYSGTISEIISADKIHERIEKTRPGQ